MKVVTVDTIKSSVTISVDEARYVADEDIHAEVMAQVVEAMQMLGLPIEIVEEPNETQPTSE